jgi:hypothetical protein
MIPPWTHLLLLGFFNSHSLEGGTGFIMEKIQFRVGLEEASYVGYVVVA